MLFNILKLFGLDVPAKIEAVKASLERPSSKRRTTSNRWRRKLR
jgi:hypothetical protein